MSVRVNLLPKEVKKRGRENRQRAAVAGGFGLLLVAIGGVYFWQVQRVNDAQEVVDEEQATVTALEGELAELQEFEELQQLERQSIQALQATMGGEVSVAGILQDVAAVTPSDAELNSLAITITGPAEAELGDERIPWGTIQIAGRTRDGHAPGVERFLLEYDKIAAFSDLFFTNSTVDEADVSSFNVQVDLGPEIRTRRYIDGLPEELR